MTLEQLIRKTLAAIEAHNLVEAASYTSYDLTVNDPSLNLPRPMDKRAFFAQMDAILKAFPDWHYIIEGITSQGELVTAAVEAVATHTQPLQLPGMPPIPATGKRVRVPDGFIFRVKDGRIVAITIASPPDGGAAEMLRQLGIRLPSRSA